MNWKRYWISTAAVLVAKGLVEVLFIGVIFESVYDQKLPGARAEGQEVHAAGLICMIAWSLAFTYIYAKGHQNKGWTEGIRFGLIAWVFYFIPMITGFYGYYAMPFNWVVAGLVSGLAASLTAGLLVALFTNQRAIELVSKDLTFSEQGLVGQPARSDVPSDRNQTWPKRNRTKWPRNLVLKQS